ncbi:MAG: ABC transporter substrate-binding protein [Alphaproteobacteria bacterium]|jgi:branched-chain amino acid transport system substrate-binding protein|nr:ABC transporter substrate-binding protein [Alphaproteobacteria bacterium]
MKHVRSGLLAASVVAAATLQAATAQADEIVVGMQCDRTGPTQTVGTFLCPGYHDYVKLINSKGGIDGHTIKVLEIDHEYKVPPGMEAYQRFKAEGAVIVAIYGTPHTQALTPLLHSDKIPGTSPGFGSAAAANGTKYPYLFPIAATYWSQGAAAVQFAKDQLGGELKGKKIAYLYYDNPAGREPLPILQKLAEMEGFQLKEFAVPPPGVEMKVQVQDIARRFRADFVINHTFGKAPSVSINEMTRNGFKLSKMVGLVWAAGESNIMGAGGWDKAQGFNVMQFAGAGSDYPVLDEIKALYKSEGKDAPKEMDSTVYYNRGLLAAALHLKAIENAVRAKGGSSDITGEDVKNGFEKIRDFTLDGILPPMAITKEDHEGGGWVRIFRVEGQGFKPITEWMHGYRDVVVEMVKSH